MDGHGTGSGGIGDARLSGRAPEFVGRADELELLRTLLVRTIRDRSPHLVTVTGEAGVGKSRLVEEFAATTAPGTATGSSSMGPSDAGGAGVLWARGRVLPPGEGAPLAALADIVRSLAGIPDGQLDADAGGVLARRLDEVLPDPAEGAWFLARMAPLVGAEGPDMGDADDDESFTAWRRYLEAEAARSPIVVAFDDLHLGGERLLGFVEYILDWSSAAPMLVVCTARPELYERRPGWGGGKRSSTTISLPPLSQPEAGTLVGALFDAAGLERDPDRAASVVDRSGGNPLFAEQFVRLLADRGPGDATDEPDVPDTIRELIAARLGALPEGQRTVLSGAAVLGPVFWPDALAEMDGIDLGRVGEDLRALSRRELVRPSRSSSLSGRQEYAFVHGLVRDVAYAEIPVRERWAKHRAASAWLERAGAGRMPAFAEALAHHDLEAVELGGALGADADQMATLSERAAGSLVRAGDQAVDVDVRRAGSLFATALQLLPRSHPTRAELLLRAGEAASITGRHQEAAALLEEAIGAFLEHGERLEAARAALDLAYAAWNQAGTARGQEALDRAFGLLEGLPPAREHARAATDRAAGLFFAGDPAGALRATEDAIDLANRVGAQDLAARVLEIRGMSRCALGDQGGLADLHGALSGSRTLGLGPETVRAYLNLGTFVTPVGGPAAALAYFAAGRELAERRGIVELGMWTKAWELGVLFELGEWDRLLGEAREVLAWDRDRGGSQLRVAALNCTAQVLAYRGLAAEAAEMADGFVGEARAVGDPQIVLPALAIAAVARSEAGDREGAVVALVGFAELYPERSRWVGSLFVHVCVRVSVAVGRMDLAERFAAEPDLTTPRGRCVDAAARAEVAEARGSFEAALALHRTAAEGWDGYGFAFERARSLLGAARCLWALGRGAEARFPALSAEETFAALDAGGLAAAAGTLGRV